MNFIAIKPPTPRMPLPGEPLKLSHTLGRIVPTSQRFQIVADYLIQTLPQRLRLLASASDGLLINGQSDIHEHSICATVLCVNVLKCCRSEPCVGRAFLLAAFDHQSGHFCPQIHAEI